MKKIMKKIALIGVGNMGTAILEGLFRHRLAKSNQVFICDKVQKKVTSFAKKWKVHPCRSLTEVLKKADVLILAVKPQDLAQATAEFQKAKSSLILISILAGTPLSKIKKATGGRFRSVRAMPNLGAKVGQGVTALTGTDRNALKVAENIFQGCGKTLILKERYFDLVTAVSGSGPAYFFLMMELLSGYGEKRGLSKNDARLLAVQTAVGAGLLSQASPFSPEQLRKMVTSKKGTTDAALKVLFAKKMPKIFYSALQAAERRGRQLSRA